VVTHSQVDVVTYSQVVMVTFIQVVMVTYSVSRLSWTISSSHEIKSIRDKTLYCS